MDQDNDTIQMDARRYRALRDFAVLADVDPARFERVAIMAERFQETTEEGDAAHDAGANHDTLSDFLIQALMETAPPAAVQQPSPAH